MELDTLMHFLIYFGVLASPPPHKKISKKLFSKFQASYRSVQEDNRFPRFRGKYETITSSLILNFIQNQTVPHLHKSHSKKAEVL